MSEVLVGDHAGELLWTKRDAGLLRSLLVGSPHLAERLVQRVSKMKRGAKGGTPIRAAAEDTLSSRGSQLLLVWREAADGAQNVVLKQDKQRTTIVTVGRRWWLARLAASGKEIKEAHNSGKASDG